MELRRSVKPLVPVAMWVRFPPSAPDTARAPAADRSLCTWEHGVIGNMMVSKTIDWGFESSCSRFEEIAEGSHNGIAPVPKTGGLVL